MGQRIQTSGFSLAGCFCLALVGLKLASEGQWSWWRVLIPSWVVLGHNALYVTVGFAWLSFADHGGGDEVTICQDHRPHGCQLAAMLCFLLFTDNLLGRIEGERTAWFWLSSDRWEVIFAPGLLSLVCQLLFWSRVVVAGYRGTRDD